jgi:hypothetical protein
MNPDRVRRDGEAGMRPNKKPRRLGEAFLKETAAFVS